MGEYIKHKLTGASEPKIFQTRCVLVQCNIQPTHKHMRCGGFVPDGVRVVGLAVVMKRVGGSVVCTHEHTATKGVETGALFVRMRLLNKNAAAVAMAAGTLCCVVLRLLWGGD